MQHLSRVIARSGPLLLPFIVVGGITAVAGAPLWADPGFLLTRGAGDSANLLFRVQQLLTAYAAGEFPARWMPDGAYGYGLPYFTYYASFSTHVAAWFKLAGFSYVVALKLAQTLALGVGALGVWGWLTAAQTGPGARPRNAGPLAAAAAYTLAPFHLVNLYVRGDSLAELWAMALTPLALWSVERLRERGSFGRMAALAVVVGGLICTHNVSALMALPFVGLYAMLRLTDGGHGRWRRLSIGGLGLGWGLAASAFFWGPALGEVDAVQLAALTNGYFSYTGHFRSTDLVQTALAFDYGSNPFAVGMVQALFAVAGLAARAMRRERWGRVDLFVVLGLFVSTILITPWSEPLYATVPGLAYVQFPWRFLGVQALFTAAVTGWLWPSEAAGDGLRRRFSAGAWLALAGALAFSALGGLKLNFVPLADEEVTAARLNLFEQTTSMIGNTANAEYLPVAVDPRPWTSPRLIGQAPKPVALSDAVSGALQSGAGIRQVWSLTAHTPTAVALPTYWWPGWVVSVDGAETPTWAASGLGFIAFDLPAGTHTVALVLRDTPVRTAAGLVSLLALGLPLISLGAWLWWAKRAWSWPGGARLTVAIVGVIVIAPLPGALAQAGAWSAGPGAWDVVPQAWQGRAGLEARPLNYDPIVLAFPHRDVVRFAGGGELIGVRLDSDRPTSGETVRVELTWRDMSVADVTLTLWPPAAPVMPEALPIASHTLPIATSAPTRFDVSLPEALAPGVYWWTVDVVAASGPLTAIGASGRERGRVFLSPFVIDSTQTAPTTVLASIGALQLHAVAGGLNGNTVNVESLWSTSAPIGEDLAFSTRLFDPSGARVAQRDSQPGGGFLPTHNWKPGLAYVDRAGLALPADSTAGAYRLEVVAYRPNTLEPIGTATATLVLAPYTTRGERSARWALTPELGLEAVSLPEAVEAGTAFTFEARWVTGVVPAGTTATWSLASVEGDVAVSQPETLTAWPSDAALRGVVVLQVPVDLTAGVYTIRAQVDGAAAAPVGQIAITASTRDFSLPPLQHMVGADFGSEIALAGYDLSRREDELRLDLVFQALATPAADYTYFVHIVDMGSGALVAQFDARPDGRPTGEWLDGEVIVQPVVIDLAAVAPGRYWIALGWYDPAQPGSPRLPALDAAGARSADDRIVLPETFELR